MRGTYGIILAAFAATVAFAQENYGTWGKSKPITINTSPTGANITDTLYNFPLLVRLDSTHAEVFTQAKPGGADLRFRTIPGGPLAYRIDNWDSAGRKAEIWVSVDRILPNNSTQQIHMIWQKADAVAASSGAAVFDSAKGFVAAWHMGGAAGNRANSTPGGIPAVPATSAVDSTFTGRSTTGVVGTADTLRGGTAAAGGEHFNVSPMPGFATGFTFSFWAQISSTASRPWMRFFDFGNGEGQDNLFAGRRASTTTVTWDVFPGQFIDATDAIVVGQWRHYTMTVTGIDAIGGTASQSALYVNGALAGTAEANYSNTPRAVSYLGRSNWADAYFTGKMDEVHISKRARPAGWAKLSYETQKLAANNVLTFGATGVPASVSPAAQAGVRPLQVNAQGRGYVFSLPAAANADMRLSVLDVHGRVVWSSVMAKGSTALAWKGLAANGQALARGMYFARLAPVSGAKAAVWEARFAHTK
jgi:hypothetical protein